MSDSSSNDVAGLFSRVHPSQVITLVQILRQVTISQVEFVESVYSERARHFDETLQFLEAAGWIKQTSGNLVLSDVAVHSDVDLRRAIESLADKPSFYQNALADYLALFDVAGGKILYRASAQNHIEQSGIRNFLIAVGLLFPMEDGDGYVLSPDFSHLYLWSKNLVGARSKTALLNRMNDQSELGTSAELAVLDYEKRRLGPEWEGHVKHISAHTPGACFDIQSLSVDTRPANLRFIEVKAVPKNNFQFFWSAAELEAATLIRQRYFLYLLPVAGGNSFDLTNMQIINDPYVAVYQSADRWEKSEHVIVCRRK
jgi:hypothetical protein